MDMKHLHLNIFSESTKHAIQAMIYLATFKDKPVLVSSIAEYYSIPGFYLSKIVQILSKNNLINSTRGRGGGVMLNKPAKKIFISDIIIAIEGKKENMEMCVYGLDICSDSVPCPVHEEWSNIKPVIKDKIMNQNLDYLSKELLKKHAALSEND